ncbi:MAG: patatin-like phospholipase family protein [Ideonella sp.]|nr:patatin-like phospholipase family protein [Ideonella sp.]
MGVPRCWNSCKCRSTIAGTSMGAIVGGLYAGGMRADELERSCSLRWARSSPIASSGRCCSRRKGGLRDLGVAGAGSAQWRVAHATGRRLQPRARIAAAPLHAAGARRGPLRRAARPLPSRGHRHGNRSCGDGQRRLALALRSSMSVPGVFSPTDVDSPHPGRRWPGQQHAGGRDARAGPRTSSSWSTSARSWPAARHIRPSA